LDSGTFAGELVLWPRGLAGDQKISWHLSNPPVVRVRHLAAQPKHLPRFSEAPTEGFCLGCTSSTVHLECRFLSRSGSKRLSSTWRLLKYCRCAFFIYSSCSSYCTLHIQHEVQHPLRRVAPRRSSLVGQRRPFGAFCAIPRTSTC